VPGVARHMMATAESAAVRTRVSNCLRETILKSSWLKPVSKLNALSCSSLDAYLKPKRFGGCGSPLLPAIEDFPPSAKAANSDDGRTRTSDTRRSLTPSCCRRTGCSESRAAYPARQSGLNYKKEPAWLFRVSVNEEAP